MIWVRSIVFNVLFYITIATICVLALPALLLPYRVMIGLARIWARISIAMLRIVCGTRCEFRGLEHRPSGAFLVAAKHQSMWETFALLLVLDDPAYILKRELRWIPLFGWYTWKARMVAVDRGRGARALVDMAERAKLELAAGRQIIIFPEGTRRPAGAEPKYKYGVAYLYEAFAKPCAPVALNSGLFWPRRSLLRFPGTMVLEFLPPIPPGLARDEFFKRMEAEIEAGTARLIDEGRRSRTGSA